MRVPTKQELIGLYVQKRWSTRRCAEYFEMSQPWLRKYLHDFNIPTRSVKENGYSSKGRVFSPDHRQKISVALKKNNGMRDKFFEMHHGYKTGKRSYRKYLLRGFLAAVCADCSSESRLQVHHVDHDRNNNLLSNLKVLCPSCHKKEHLRRPLPQAVY